MTAPLLTVIIPVYNEESTILEVIQSVNQVDIKKEIIVVNDGSTDNTPHILSSLKYLILLHHQTNLGKGAAIQTAIPHITGEYVIFQDGDLETTPKDYLKLLGTIQHNDCDVVFGSRWLGKSLEHTYHTFGNKVITWWANTLNTQKITDLASCYKLIPSTILRELNIRSKGFGLEAEITAKIDRLVYTIKEVPIQYNRRSVAEGKKLRLKDGLVAAWSCFRYRVF
ncbi:MAG: glycosyltransferase family 2 protein [Candidatus Marinimicrobia bacterium]|nr:glycosyltransferase family 2 protein [Candidatus Neomarinimicrobiota bacterium]